MKLQNTPIQRKLTIIIMLTTSMVLAVTCVAFAVYEIFSFRRTLVQEMTTIANVVAANSTAAVAFADEGAGKEILSALDAEDNVLRGALYDGNGRLLARYSAEPSDTNVANVPNFIGHRFEKGTLLFAQPVERAHTRVGTLLIESDLRDIYDRLGLYGLIVAVVMAGGFLMAFIVSRWLQQSISQPILELAHTARVVTEKKDYSVRAQNIAEAELGDLTNAFNEMLSEIDSRDAELLASRERLKLALSASQTGTWEWNLETNRITWDEFTEKLFGLERGSFHGGSAQLIELFHKQDRPAVAKAVEATLQHGKELKVEGRVIRRDGSEHHLALRGKGVLEYPGNTRATRVMGVCMDITERRRAEERIRRMNSELEERVLLRTSELTASHHEMEAFTYSVSHDLRAPLRHITAFAEILLEEFSDSLSEEARDYLQRILRGTQSMSQLVDDLLNLARIGRQGLNLQSVEINEIVQEIVAEFQPELKDRNVHWEIREIPEVSADPGLIRQVIANLLSNAIKYTRPRKEAIIEVGSTSSNDETIIFIRDNGVGFDMKFADKLFGVFQRLHRTEEFEGTGVGLALTEKIVHKHGGRIWAESVLDKGATFYFSLPIVKIEANPMELEPAGKHA